MVAVAIDARGEDMFRRVLNGIAIILTYINLSKVRRASWNTILSRCPLPLERCPESCNKYIIQVSYLTFDAREK